MAAISLKSMNIFLRLLLSLALGANLQAQELSSISKQVLNSYALKYSDLKKWKARFTQQTIHPVLGTDSFNNGEFAFESPNKFRFSLVSTDHSDFISNGQQAWHLIFKKGRSENPYVKNFKKAASLDLDRYLLLLRGVQIKTKKDEVEFLKKFSVEGSIENQILKLKLKPKKSSEISEITLLAKNSDKVPYEMIIVDALGVSTKIGIAAWEKVKSFDPKLFEAQIPKGSEVEIFE